MENTLLIGIAGGTGSGKTTLTDRILDTFGSNISILRHDNYYRAHDELTLEERARMNYDHPDSFETALLIEDLKKLKRGETVFSPLYDYSSHNRFKDRTLEVKPNRVILVEGILIFCDPELKALFDIRIFVDTDADVRILRRLVRDVRERGRTMESVISQYLDTVKPMHEQFVEPIKHSADIIVPMGGENQVALDMIFQKIRSHLN